MMETLSTPMSASSFIGAIKLIIKFKVQHSKFKVKKMSNRFTSRLSDDDDFKRDELIRKIEHSVEQMTLSELEALSYDMFTKGYMEDY
jgi:protocatechuate 3,4-dioxygenase beta subunit